LTQDLKVVQKTFANTVLYLCAISQVRYILCLFPIIWRILHMLLERSVASDNLRSSDAAPMMIMSRLAKLMFLLRFRSFCRCCRCPAISWYSLLTFMSPFVLVTPIQHCAQGMVDFSQTYETLQSRVLSGQCMLSQLCMQVGVNMLDLDE